jgi:hypothetical protein
MSAKPAHHRLRELLLAVLRTDADFAAFVMDHHPQVAQRFSDGQDRVQKTNLLLWHVAGQVILQELRQSWPKEVTSFEYQHGPIAATDILERLRFAHAESWQRTQAMTFALGAGLVAGLWLTLRVTSPSPAQTATTPNPSHLEQPAAIAPDLAPAMQPLAGGLRDCKGHPVPRVRVVVLGKQIEGLSDANGQFSLRVPGQPEEPVQLRLQTTPTAEAHDHWVNLGQTHLTLPTKSCAQ